MFPSQMHIRYYRDWACLIFPENSFLATYLQRLCILGAVACSQLPVLSSPFDNHQFFRETSTWSLTILEVQILTTATTIYRHNFWNPIALGTMKTRDELNDEFLTDTKKLCTKQL